MINIITYNTSGVCAKVIRFELVNGTVKNVNFSSGCPGNLAAISKLVENMPADMLIETLQGITCGHKATSCADQLATAVALELQKETQTNK